MQRVLQGLQRRTACPAATPARRWAAGSARRSRRVDDLKGLKMRIGGIAGEVHAPSSAWCRSRSPAATSIRRSRRARSTPPNGSAPTTTRSSASTRSRRTTTIPAGGKADRSRRSSSTSTSGTRCRRPTRRSLRMAAADDATTGCVAKYDAENPKALRGWSRPAPSCSRSRRRSWRPAFDAANERLCRDSSAKNAKLQEDLRIAGWRSATNEVLWFRVAENTFDNFMARQSAANKL